MGGINHPQKIDLLFRCHGLPTLQGFWQLFHSEIEQRHALTPRLVFSKYPVLPSKVTARKDVVKKDEQGVAEHIGTVTKPMYEGGAP